MRIGVLEAGRWLVPWACVTAASAGLAYAADQGLVHVLAVPEAAPNGRGAAPMRQIQIIVFHPDRPSTVMECMAQAESESSEVLEFWDNNAALEAISSLCASSAEPIDMTARRH